MGPADSTVADGAISRAFAVFYEDMAPVKYAVPVQYAVGAVARDSSAKFCNIQPYFRSD